MKATGARALVWLFLLAWEACAKREDNVHYSSLQAQSVGASEVEEAIGLAAEDKPPGLTAAVLANQRRQQERARKAAAERQKREQQRRQQQRIREQKRREAEREAEKFRRENTIDCSWDAEWGSWGECSATCGGGVRTRTLRSLVVTRRQDEHGFGRACPRECFEDTCSEQEFEGCNEDICDIDCSTIDLGNNLSSGGVAVQWDYQPLEGHCVFQFWQVLESKNGIQVLLLGETEPSEADGNMRGSWLDPVMISGTAASSVVLGFRGCTLQGLPDAPSSSTGKVCLYEDKPFQANRQTATLSRKQNEALNRLRRNYQGAEQFSRSAEDYNFLYAPWSSWPKWLPSMDRSTRLALPPSFSLSATMDPQAPAQPRIEQALETGDDLLIIGTPSALDGGAVVTAYTAAVRKVFGGSSNCEFTSLPECSSDISKTEPCTKLSTSTSQEVSLLLRNLQLASNYEVKVKALNSAGASPPSRPIKVSTRAAPGVPKSECAVSAWLLEDDDAKAVLPQKDEVKCQLQAPPLALCVMKPRTSFFKKTKCDGKKYWRRFKPYMSAGDQDCVKTSFNPMTVCEHDLAHFDGSNEAERCEAEGCGTSSLPSLLQKKKHCCCESAEDSEADSPSCACSQASCGELGLFDAKDPMLSCRH